jgi:hypothetical protein
MKCIELILDRRLTAAQFTHTHNMTAKDVSMCESIKKILLGAEYLGTNRKPKLLNENAGVGVMCNKIDSLVVNLSG